MEKKVLSIGQICSRFSSGKNITAVNIKAVGEYPVYGGNGLRGYTSTYNFDGECSIVGRQGAYCGNVKYVVGKSYMSEHAIVAVTRPEHNNKYFSYKLALANLGRFSGQAAQPGLSVTKLLRLKFEMPSKSYQDKIASILSTYDTLIENNTKRIRLLEQMAENLYKEWFVRFRFPGHENAEMGNGLPKGWKIERYGDIATITAGGDCPVICSDNKTLETFVPIYSNGISNNGLYGYTDKPRITEPCITISARGTVGFVCLRDEPFVPIVRLLAVIPIKLGVFYLYHSTKYNDLEGNGTSQQQLTKPMLAKRKIIIPSKAICDRFEIVVSSLYKQIKNLSIQNQLLTRQRDLLLPRLMSGKLEVTV